MPATTPENLDRINAMFQANANLLANLCDRWASEREFENIEDYAVQIKTALPAGFELLAMTKRPFGFKFTIGTGATYHMTANARGVTWKRI